MLGSRFQIIGKAPLYNRWIDFNMYKEGGGETWNGYYRDYRIKLWMSELTWVVQVYENGTLIGVWINRKTECSLEDLERLIQVGIFFIDQLEKWKE